MPIRYRLVDAWGKALADADSIGVFERIAAGFAPGGHTVDEISRARCRPVTR